MRDFIKNKPEILYILLLFIFSLIMFILFYGRFGLFFTDTSREVYVPYAMTQGSVLYKDIFNAYQPLAYQINALLFSLSGGRLSALYTAGFINSFLFTAGLFLAVNLFCRKEDKKLNFLFCLFVTVSCVYAVSQSNYIFPYSYSMVYALNAVIWALYFLLKSVKTPEAGKYIILSALFSGISISCKYEFIFFIPVLLWAAARREINIKTKLFSLAAFLAAPVISLTALILQGCSFEVLKESAGYIKALAVSKSVHKCYSFLGIIPSAASLKFIAANAVKYILCAAVFCFIGNKIYKLNKAAAGIFCAAIVYFLIPVFYLSNAYFFDYAGMLLSALFLILAAYLFKKLKNKTFNNTDKMFFVFIISAVLLSAKNIFSMNLSNYGAYYAPPALAALWTAVYYYSKEIFNINLKAPLCLLFSVLFAAYLFSNSMRRDYAFQTPIETEKGVVYIPGNQAEAVKGVINYIQKNTKKEDKLLVIPEGAMINYLTDRKSHDKYYYLIPPNAEIFGEENIKRGLEAELPDYIIMPLLTYQNFGETYFCGSYGGKICALLPEYYENPAVFGSEFWTAVYKKKEKNAEAE